MNIGFMPILCSRHKEDVLSEGLKFASCIKVFGCNAADARVRDVGIVDS